MTITTDRICPWKTLDSNVSRLQISVSPMDPRRLRSEDLHVVLDADSEHFQDHISHRWVGEEDGSDSPKSVCPADLPHLRRRCRLRHSLRYFLSQSILVDLLRRDEVMYTVEVFARGRAIEGCRFGRVQAISNNFIDPDQIKLISLRNYTLALPVGDSHRAPS